MSKAATIRHLKSVAKLLLGVAIVAFLFYQAKSGENFEEIVHKQKNWRLLAVSMACVAAAVLFGFLRWYLLVRAVGLPFTLRDAFRLGSLGFALNFVAPGGVGGDLFKVVALAREHSNRKSEAIATVVADRIMGLAGLLLVTSGALLITRLAWEPSSTPAIKTLSYFVLSVTAGLFVGLGLLMIPGQIGETVARTLAKVPIVGHFVSNLFSACHLITRQSQFLFPALTLSVAVHLLLVMSFYYVAEALPVQHPSLAIHFCIVPLAETAGVLPLTPGGLGTTEATLSALYIAVGADGDVGTFVAFGQRLVMLSVGALAIVYFLIQRKSVEAALHEAEEELDAEEHGAGEF
ncbi:lysylphosphatidylglycerol synthase transmembrane domain-containing protein [Aeoliella sp.]|uniref:lysylphosphatidylglycerol synthase transmembrane domain-containing protein n=1 Tax=Aeoliella sp. TaxID=2795800 RepID=UPI003CCC22A6